jgi:hypothetical protein
MKTIQNLGLVIFLVGLSIFTATIFTGSFRLSQSEFDSFIANKGYKSDIIKKELQEAVVTNENLNIFEFSSKVITAYNTSNTYYEKIIKKYDY